jgi:hypothetical protein
MPDTAAQNLMAQIMSIFPDGTKTSGTFLMRHLNVVKKYLPPDKVLSDVQKSLIGAYFTNGVLY